eukprot:GHVL01039461.1.p1 GENE.GHVL01039461.1~~GHVL01039461.1.p1  ORF type:complete len:104 (-),score=26.81 GHVL01039461.1:122-433(-)
MSQKNSKKRRASSETHEWMISAEEEENVIQNMISGNDCSGCPLQMMNAQGQTTKARLLHEYARDPKDISAEKSYKSLKVLECYKNAIMRMDKKKCYKIIDKVL